MTDTPVRRGKPRGEPNAKLLENGASAFVTWEELGLAQSDRGPYENLSNAMLVLNSHPELKDKIWADDFLQRIVTIWNGPKREWQDGDDLLLTEWFQRVMRMPKISAKTVTDAAEAIAFINRKNEVREWLETLQWDRVVRLPTMLSDAFGAEQNDYTAAVGRCWMVSLIARALNPGSKADYVPVFEGIEGIKKSTAMKIIGGDWFVEIHEQITSKDFMQALQGVWLIEIAELNAFSKAEIRRIKGVISNQNDYYRASYGRRHQHHPRQCIFVATTNEKEWNESDTGARRFWPIICSEINDGYLRQNREQLFAEALIRYRAGEKWWDVPGDLAKIEQDMRRPQDSWTDRVENWLQVRTSCSCAEVLEHCILMAPEKQDMRQMKRMGALLRRLGWHPRQTWTSAGNLLRWHKNNEGLNDLEESIKNPNENIPLDLLDPLDSLI